MKRIFHHGVLLIVFLVSAGSCSGDERVLRTSDREGIRLEDMIREVKGSRIIFVGETHDSERDHRLQLDIIKGLDRADVALAVGLEMFRTDSQKELDEWTKGEMGLDEFLKVYGRNWNIPWSLYRDIFLYARDRRIPMVGLNVPEVITKKVSREGFSSLTDDELKQLPPGISCDVDREYMDYIRKAYRIHAAADSSFVHFCEAQMVWDKTMAWNLTEFLKKNPKKTVVVLAGIGHSWKRGIPDQFGKLSGLPFRVVLPEVPEHVTRTTILSQDADYVLLR